MIGWNIKVTFAKFEKLDYDVIYINAEFKIWNIPALKGVNWMFAILKCNKNYMIRNRGVKSHLKVCYSSAFKTISRRSVYIKIINYSDSISANLNNTMQTKQHEMKKPHSNSNRNKI